ncbi:hypothetical protein F941_02302 [Acinetobacter bouvetii DSM 14964 = CIP 107468]|uniref:Pyrrolo-quinoline quinone repeat domain-containing protein n=1 Tax=Acinetobacter bouvetii DSM 14964 = CIP 107468 TaxID=1120925 RepID=N9C8K8_9GAMM|nr:PQQ-binding-like beta-propeller repeat protein [Acinetobacter bouvetii]ENV82172.1 hypothetical protein F941_02302 [Acinetobacter bouvetii DSM 14964 = CIP 107468]BCU64101.1 hypothetical protein ACBO_08920 [Acinetobacter bouvetii]
MYKKARFALISTISLALVACGGGNSGDGSNSSTPATPALLLTPTTLNQTLYEGESQELNLKATVNTTIVNGSVYVLVIDSSNVIEPSILVSPESSNLYNVRMTTKASLALGKHIGALDIMLCRDSACKQQYPGSPVKAPYSFTVTPPPPSFSTSPTAITLEQDVDDNSKAVIQIQVTDRIKNVLPKVTISGDIHFTQSFSQTDAKKYNLELTVPSDLAVGTHTGTVNVSLCLDESCSKTYAGSPQKIPYTIKIKPIVNLTALIPITGVTGWEMFQGNAAHTGYVPITIDPKKITRRWSWNKPSADNGALSTITASQGKIFAVSYVITSTGSKRYSIHSINENNASTAWTQNFNSHTVNPPSVSDGKVFVASSGHGDTAMWQFDAATGVPLFKTPFYSQWDNYLAPTIKNGKVYTNGGYYGGVNSFNISDGTDSWFQALNPYDMWTPAVDANYVYAYTGNMFSVLSAKDGHKVFEIPDPTYNRGSYSINSAPVIGSLGNVLVANGLGHGGSNNLISYNIAQRNVNWTLNGEFKSMPAVANKVVYVTNASPFRLEARNEADGTLIWSWLPDNASTTQFIGNIVVTTNLIFVATNAGTYAIDKTTHVPVWHFKKTGNLAITSNGILLVNDASTIYAINLK